MAPHLVRDQGAYKGMHLKHSHTHTHTPNCTHTHPHPQIHALLTIGRWKIEQQIGVQKRRRFQFWREWKGMPARKADPMVPPVTRHRTTGCLTKSVTKALFRAAPTDSSKMENYTAGVDFSSRASFKLYNKFGKTLNSQINGKHCHQLL